MCARGIPVSKIVGDVLVVACNTGVFAWDLVAQRVLWDHDVGGHQLYHLDAAGDTVALQAAGVTPAAGLTAPQAVVTNHLFDLRTGRAILEYEVSRREDTSTKRGTELSLSHDGQVAVMGQEPPAAVVAFNASTGTVIWEHDATDFEELIVVDSVVVVGGKTVLDLTSGDLLWELDTIGSGRLRGNVGPVLSYQRDIKGGFVVSATTGDQLIEFDGPNRTISMDGAVLLGLDGYSYDGEKLWSVSSSLVEELHVLDTTVIVETTSGQFIHVDPRTGSEASRFASMPADISDDWAMYLWDGFNSTTRIYRYDFERR